MGSDGSLRASPVKEQTERLLLLLTQGNEPFPQKFAHTHQLFQSSWDGIGAAAASLDILQGKQEFLLGVLFPSLCPAGAQSSSHNGTVGRAGFAQISSPVVCYIPNAMSAFQSCERRALGQSPLVSKELHRPVEFHGPVPPGPASGNGNEWQRQGW